MMYTFELTRYFRNILMICQKYKDFRTMFTMIRDVDIGIQLNTIFVQFFKHFESVLDCLKLILYIAILNVEYYFISLSCLFTRKPPLCRSSRSW